MTYTNDKNYNCRIETTDNLSFDIHANQIHNNKHDYFSGWSCHAGYHRINIDEDGKVWSGSCRNDYLGTVDDWNLLSASTVCKQNRCNGCTDDLIVEKNYTVSTSVL